MIIKALKAFSDGAISMHEGEIRMIADLKANLFISAGYAIEYSEPLSEAELDNVTLKKINGLVGTVNTRITGKYNVLDYGLKNDGTTDNTSALVAMLNAIPSGAIVYFPQGVYNISDTVEIEKGVLFVGETSTVQKHTLSNTMHPETQINYVGNKSNISLFERARAVTVVFKNLTFYGNSYDTAENEEEFTTLPYNVFSATIEHENINCLSLDSVDGEYIVQDCLFYGFSGYAVSIGQHKYIKNCGFYKCAIGVKETKFDSIIENCWFCRGGVGILCTDPNGNGYTNLSVSGCWCDQMTDHFIKCEGQSVQTTLLVNDAWVDMIDKAGIYVEGILNGSNISGRFSRCGMSWAGVTDANKTDEVKPSADAICAYRISNTVIDATIAKRKIDRGNNRNGVSPAKAVSSTNKYIKNCTISCYDTLLEDIFDADYSLTDTKVHGKDGALTRYSSWSYAETPIHFRTSAPTGVQAPRANCLCINTNTGDIYLSLGASSNTVWEKIVAGDKGNN